MGYYRGDAGYGMARGDPGFFSFLGGLAKKAIGFIPGVGPIASGGLGLLSSHAKVPTAPGGMLAKYAGPGLAFAKKHPGLIGAGALGLGALALGGKKGLKSLRVHPVTGQPMKAHRRMHVTNVRALRRAIRRANGFAKLARRVLHFTSPRAPKGRAHFRFHKKKRV